MNNINNNKFEVNPSPRNKRKRSLDCSNVFMNPALDLLSTDDPICNTTMEIVPAKRQRRSRSCDGRVTFENPALDLGYQKKDIRSLLWKELKNVNEKLTTISEVMSPPLNLPIHNTSDYSLEDKSIQHMQYSEATSNQNSTPVFQSNFPLRRSVSFDLSFIEKLDLDDVPNGDLYLDDDLNESNIMEIKTITTIALRKSPQIIKKKNTNPFLSDYMEDEDVNLQPAIKGDFPFDLPVPTHVTEPNIVIKNQDDSQPAESSYDATSDVSNIDTVSLTSVENQMMPRRLFTDDTCETVSLNTINPSFSCQIQSFQNSTFKDKHHSVPISRNLPSNKQSKILGFDVSNITRSEIFDKTETQFPINQFKCNKEFKKENIPHSKSETQNCKPKKNGKISSKIFSKIKEAFKHEKKQHKENMNTTVNPFEVVRPKEEKPPEKVGFENPALNLNSTDIEFEEMEDESPLAHYSQRNPHQITPLKKINYYDANYPELQNYTYDDVNMTDMAQQSILKKHVRFDTTLNHEKVITGSSFDSDTPSASSESRDPSNTNLSGNSVLSHIDNEIDEYHNELENCFNERKLISQNL